MNLNTTEIIILIIIIGFISSIIASFMGLGGGIVAIPLILLVIGGEYNDKAKLIAYVSITALSIVGVIKYIHLKKKPNFQDAFYILVGALPLTIIADFWVSDLLKDDSIAPYFHLIYCLIIIGVTFLVNKARHQKSGLIKNKMWLPVFGAGIGFLSGTIGLSGGVLYIPLLVLGLNYDLKKAAVTSLALKFPVALINVITHAGMGSYNNFAVGAIPWFLPLIILVGSVSGALIGPRLSKRMSTKKMSFTFNAVMGCLLTLEVVHFILMITNVI